MATMARIAEKYAIIGTIDPDAYGTGTQTTDIIDMRYWRRVIFVVMAGTLGSSATLNFTVASSAASNMGSPSSMTDKAITQLTQAGTDDDKQVIVEVTAEEVASNGTLHRYIQGTATLAAASSDYGVIILGEPAHFSGDVTAQDLATVDEIVG